MLQLKMEKLKMDSEQAHIIHRELAGRYEGRLEPDDEVLENLRSPTGDKSGNAMIVKFQVLVGVKRSPPHAW